MREINPSPADRLQPLAIGYGRHPRRERFRFFATVLVARFAVAFLADDFFTVRFRRFGCIAIGGTSKGSDTSPAAANGM